jgi:hypothetical protein
MIFGVIFYYWKLQNLFKYLLTYPVNQTVSNLKIKNIARQNFILILCVYTNDVILYTYIVKHHT